MKIAVYSNCPLDPVLGSGKTRVRWSEGLARCGHEVRVFGPAEFEFMPRLRGGRRFRLGLGAALHARRLLAAGAPDCIEYYGGEFGWMASLVRRRAGRPLLVHHSDGCELLVPPPAGGPTMRRRMHQSLDRPSFSRADGCIVGCEIDRKFLESERFYAADRLDVVPPGVDDEFLVHPEPGMRPARLGFVGSWIERKQVGLLASVAAEIMGGDPSLEFDVFGTGRPEASIRGCFPEAVRSRVHVAGRLETAELSRRLAGVSVFVFPSVYEGFGMATAEAMACGCAVVTTPTGFGGGLIPGVDSEIVGIGDRGGLLAAIRGLVGDGERRLAISRAGWRRVRTHRWETGIGRIDALYRAWLAGHAAGMPR